MDVESKDRALVAFLLLTLIMVFIALLAMGVRP